jgi:hypothetical protein
MKSRKPPASDGSMRLMESNRRRRRAEMKSTPTSQQFQALLALLLVLVVCILIEIVVVDTVFLGPTGHITNVRLSNQDYFISDMGGISQGAYLKAPKRAIHAKVTSDQYGTAAKIVGLDTCRHYRKVLDEGDGASMTVQGLFQERMPLFIQLIRKNCLFTQADSATDVVYDSPVEEHYPLRTFPSNVLPIVLVQDPLPWMTTICRNRPHVLDLETRSQNNCPVLDEAVRVSYLRFRNATTHRSLAHLWNDWYEPWLSDHLGPRLLIRAEDVLLHPQELVMSVCECLGGRTQPSFVKRAPWHVDDVPNRLDSYDADTLEYAMEHLDSALLDSMGYQYAPAG